MDNFKLGFNSKFGSQLGAGLSSGVVGGAVAQPQSSVFGNNMKLGLSKPGEADTSIRKSNLLSTPSSKGGKIFDNDVDEFENN